MRSGYRRPPFLHRPIALDDLAGRTEPALEAVISAMKGPGRMELVAASDALDREDIGRPSG